MKVMFAWRDPESNCYFQDGDKDLGDLYNVEGNPVLEKAHKCAQKIAGHYTDGESVYLEVDTETGEAALIGKNSVRVPLPKICEEIK